MQFIDMQKLITNICKTENIIKHLEKNKNDVDSLKKFIKNNKLILKTEQRFKSERHNFLLIL